MSNIEISFVIPVWNEEENIKPFMNEIKKYLVNKNYELIFVCDPSTDKTEKILEGLAKTDNRVRVILMSRKFGQPMATLAGLKYTLGDCAIILDIDLQDPPSLIPEMLKWWKKGFEVVLPQRQNRLGENPIRLLIAKFAYKLIDKFSNLNMPRNVSDFRLIDRLVINQINLMDEKHGYLRGMVAYAGFKTKYIKFNRPARNFGKSKYNSFTGSLKIGGNGIFAYSTLGLSIIFNLGIVLGIFSLFMAFSYLIAKIIGYPFPIGYPSIVISIFGIGAINILSMAIVGQYIERIYEETRQRPRYIIRKTININ